MLSGILRDLRFALRLLAKSPGFTAVAVGSLALGIAVNTSLFTVVNALLLRPLPYGRPDELVEISQPRRTIPMDELRKARSFQSVGAYLPWGLLVTRDGSTAQVFGAKVSASLFSLLEVQPAFGRVFGANEEDQPVVIMSYDYWRSTSGDPNIIGKTIRMGELDRTVVGVLPADFTLFFRDGQLWIPQRLTQGRLLARLRPGVSRDQADAETAAIIAGLPPEPGPAGRPQTPRVTPLAIAFIPNDAPTVLILQAAVGMVLLITCANVANLLLVRAAARRREFAIRTAIGAGRWQVARQLMAESVLLAAFGGALGLLLAQWSVSFLRVQLPVNLTRILRGADGLSIDARVIAFTAGATLLTALLFGMAPVVGALRFDVMACLRDSARGTIGGRQRFGSLLAAAEIALALMLVTGAGLMLKSLDGLEKQDLGFRADHVLRAAFELPASRYPLPEHRVTVFADILRQVQALPGVEAAGLLAPQFFPFGGPRVTGAPLEIEGQVGLEARAETYVASPDYFRTVRIPLIRGRVFTENDTPDSEPVALISDVVARRYWPQGDPLGRRIRPQPSVPGNPWVKIVGIVGNTRNPVGRGFQPTVYRPWTQNPYQGAIVLVRAAGDPAALTPEIRRVLRGFDPGAPEFRITSLETAVRSYIGPQRFTASLFGFFATMGLLLAGLGVYGVMRHRVSTRIPEIGVRLALGASPGDVLRMVLAWAGRTAALGAAVGLAGALALQRVIASELYGVSPTDPMVFTGVCLLIVGIALAAAFLPARWASKVDPLVALRHE